MFILARACFSDKEFSRFKEFSSFLGMPLEGCDKEIRLLLSK